MGKYKVNVVRRDSNSETTILLALSVEATCEEDLFRKLVPLRSKFEDIGATDFELVSKIDDNVYLANVVSVNCDNLDIEKNEILIKAKNENTAICWLKDFLLGKKYAVAGSPCRFNSMGPWVIDSLESIAQTLSNTFDFDASCDLVSHVGSSEPYLGLNMALF